MSKLNHLGSYPGSSYTLEGNYEKGITTLNREAIQLIDMIAQYLDHPCMQYTDKFSPNGLICALQEIAKKKKEGGLSSARFAESMILIEQLQGSVAPVGWSNPKRKN